MIKKDRVFLGYDTDLGLYWAICDQQNKPDSKKVPGLLLLTLMLQRGISCYMVFNARIDCKLAGQLPYWLQVPDLRFWAVAKVVQFLSDSKLIDTPRLEQ